jgi:3-phenylpropionate/trans-cinnamate dioxygenase ferredoxin reductase subunit
MENYKYLIIGGGMAANAAIRGIREIDPTGPIGMVSSDIDPPYKRPYLSKGLWKNKPFDSVWLPLEDQDISRHFGRLIVSLNGDQLIAKDDQGDEYHGEKVLLATAGTPKRLPFGGDAIIYFRSLQDYRLLSSLAETKNEFAVIGGGFIGAEIAAALAMKGKKVSLIFPEDSIGARIYPKELSQFLNDFYRQKGVEVLAGEQIDSYSSNNGRHTLKLKSRREISADGVVAGIGLALNLDLPKSIGLLLGNGVEVDEFLRTSRPNIFAAGDIAEFHNPTLGKRIHLEHEDNALTMGRQAGRNMAGASEPFTYLPYFYSDLFELGYEAVGELDSRLKTATDWAEPFNKGVIYYFREDRVCGVLLWNVWDRVPVARELIAKPGPFKAGDIDARRSLDWKISF